MIRVKTIHEEIVLNPTIFPDGTSQIWKLPEEILSRKKFFITWNFEAEREIVDLYSFRALFNSDAYIHLHIPYFPYARQDKGISNNTTFNAYVFGQFINGLGFQKITTVDVHSKMSGALIKNFENLSIKHIHEKAILDFDPTYIVFPDKGAKERYGEGCPDNSLIYCEKVRDQATGNILKNHINMPKESSYPKPFDRMLIIDDICDGGATFIGVAKSFRELEPNLTIGLFVTHGIFSKGRQHLLDNGIDKIYTTNSLPKNADGYKV